MQRSWFTRKKRPTLGIDIGSSAVKALLLQPNDDDLSVLGAVIEQIPEQALQNRVIQDFDALALALKKIKRQINTHNCDVALAIAGSHVISKRVQVETQLSEYDLEEQILLEVDSFLPFPLEDIYLDFEHLGVSHTHQGKDDVLLTAAHRELVDSRCTLLREEKLEPTVMDVEYNALVNVILKHIIPSSDSVEIVLHIGHEMMHICALYENKLVYHKEHQFGLSGLVSDVMSSYQQDRDSAIKSLFEDDLEHSWRASIYPIFVAHCAQQCQRALQLFQHSFDSCNNKRIWLSGGVSQLPDIQELLGNELNHGINILNPVADLRCQNNVARELLTRYGSQFTLAYGLCSGSILSCHR